MSAIKNSIDWDRWEEEQDAAFDDSVYGPDLAALYRVHARLVQRMADTQAGYRVSFRTVHDITQLIFEIEAGR